MGLSILSSILSNQVDPRTCISPGLPPRLPRRSMPEHDPPLLETPLCRPWCYCQRRPGHPTPCREAVPSTSGGATLWALVATRPGVLRSQPSGDTTIDRTRRTGRGDGPVPLRASGPAARDDRVSSRQICSQPALPSRREHRTSALISLPLSALLATRPRAHSSQPSGNTMQQPTGPCHNNSPDWTARRRGLSAWAAPHRTVANGADELPNELLDEVLEEVLDLNKKFFGTNSSDKDFISFHFTQ